ncbi:hypothetical protein GDO81_012780 [Engystomops pustulosus]|uniref:Uncharacterized protein n=1 Tax=Engystomops pustulosus TaxID=76066 RepID=A0AAV7AUQ4_ENGPU|nr:hypothetical protein GDO81_012780 [Engystomops pustulosus]
MSIWPTHGSSYRRVISQTKGTNQRFHFPMFTITTDSSTGSSAPNHHFFPTFFQSSPFQIFDTRSIHPRSLPPPPLPFLRKYYPRILQKHPRDDT